jgi:hypothetical protein
MAQDKEERATGATGSSRRTADSDEKKAASERASARGAANGGNRELAAARHRQYLIALRHPGTMAAFGAPAMAMTPVVPQSVDAIVDYLEHQDDVEVAARLKPAKVQPFGPDGSYSQDVVVARMAEGRADGLRASAQPHVIVDRDARLTPTDGLPLPMRAMAASGLLPLSPIVDELALRILGERDQPQAKATVVVFGPGFPVQAVTDDSGMARIGLFGGGIDSVRAIYVKPKANHWERLIAHPELVAGGATTIKLRPLGEWNAAHPQPAAEPPHQDGRAVRWSDRLLRLDQASGANLTGAGVRVGLIDTGCDNSHPALRHVTRGRDFTGTRSDTGWTDDVLGYGTHAAGLIAAASVAGQDMVGAAPEAELHAFKVCPGGRLSDLLAALDECLARELDIVCISVGCEEPSELLEQKLSELRHKGIACIKAASGTWHGESTQPFAIMPSAALTVGAVGKLGEFPPDTCHTEALMPGLVGFDGVFPAAFGGAAPQVELSAPGVAVVSTVPGGLGALDGTGTASAAVCGLAALVLAHHPLLQGPLKARNEQRVAALFGLLRACAVPYFPAPLHGGLGVPDLTRVPGLFAAEAAMHRLPGAASLGAAAFAAQPFATGAFAPPWQTLMNMRAAGWI